MIEWSNTASLVSAQGTLNLNAGSGARYLLDKKKCRAIRTLRVTTDPVPQGDGEIFHRRFTDGIEVTLAVRLWDGAKPACGAVARLMYEQLALHLSTMLNEDGRFYWTPSDWPDSRMMLDARWLSPIEITYEANDEATCEFTIDCPYPYFIDSTQREEDLPDAATITLVNGGNADFYPVIKVYGPADSFTILNATTDQLIAYDAYRPGAIDLGSSQYAEINTYRNTIYLNGDAANMKAGIDPTLTDYFVLVPGENDIEVQGADAIMLVNDAWLP